MLASSLPDLELRLEACLLELEKLYHSRPRLPSALDRAEAGRRIHELLEEVSALQAEIDAAPAETLQDAAVKLRRLGAYLVEEPPARLLARAPSAVERDALRSTWPRLASAYEAQTAAFGAKRTIWNSIDHPAAY